jgi:heterodisulfide reductase subunit C
MGNGEKASPGTSATVAGVGTKAAGSVKKREFNIPRTGVDTFADILKKVDGFDVNACYQCRKCTSGCPVAYAMDYTPTQIIHAVRLGLKDMVLNSTAIWLCASCETCTTRCPQDLDLAGVLNSLRMMAVRERVKPSIPDVAAFYRTGLSNILFFGRMYEPALMAALKLSTRQIMKDKDLAVKMLRKRKLNLMPEIKVAMAPRRVVSRVKRQEKA